MNSSSASKFLSAAASAAATAMVVRTIAQDFLPEEFENYLYDTLRTVRASISNQFTMVIEEYHGLVSNEIYAGAEIYLGSRVSSSSNRLKVNKPEKENMVVRMDEGEEVTDVFNGAVFRWSLMHRKLLNDRKAGVKSSSAAKHAPPNYIKLYCLSFHKKHKQMVLDEYLPYIMKESESIKQEKKTLKIFTMDIDGVWGDGDNIWTPMQLDHPSNFETLAMDSNLKKTIMEDLERFVSRREFYRRVGRAWKRGYLLYGPPGTGKSSLIAAMANYLKFDVYDMELTELDFNSELRSILLATANRSILVFEDIDCSVRFKDRTETTTTPVTGEKKAITLSGLLNFIDGLWSCAGDERIIIFTTNHKDKLDPALLRPGRMDMHIHMSYCTPCAFKTLAKSYLMIEEHHLFEEIEGCIVKAEVTPAEVAGELMKGDDPDIVLSGLVEFLHKKNIEHDQAKEKAAKEAEEANRKAKEATEEVNRKAIEAAKEVEEANRKAKEAAEEVNRKAIEAAKEVEEANRKAKEAAENEEKVKETQIKEKQKENQDELSRVRKTATLIKRATIVIVVLLLVMIFILRGLNYKFVFQVISD